VKRDDAAMTLRRRIALTYRYLGAGGVAWRLVTFPLRFTPLRGRLRLGSRVENAQATARAWYRAHGLPVTVVFPTYGDPSFVAEAVASVRRTTRRDRVRIVVADDASAPEHVAALRAIEGIDELILGDVNVGFAANANRGLRAADPRHDVVLLNADVVALPSWLACLQRDAYHDDVGIVGAKLLYPDGRIQHAGVHRNLAEPVWFDHRYRFKPADHGPANVTALVLAVTGA
jgi:hypothetical protein